MGPGIRDPAWEGFLLGIRGRGRPAVVEDLKRHAGPQHWTPAEAFAAARGGAGRRPRGRAARGPCGSRAAGAGAAPAWPRPATSPSSVGRCARPRPPRRPTGARPACPPSPGHDPASTGKQATVALHLAMLDGAARRGVRGGGPFAASRLGRGRPPHRTPGAPPGRNATSHTSAAWGRSA